MSSYIFDDAEIKYSETKIAGERVITIDEVKTGSDWLALPSNIEGLKVSELGKKSLMGLKIKSLMLPYGIKTVGNWAFYGMKRLKTVYISDSVTDFGKDVFEKSDGIEKIYYYDGMNNQTIDDINTYVSPKNEAVKQSQNSKMIEEKAMLLATLIALASDYSLLIPTMDEGWFLTWDERAKEFLYSADEEGFSPVLAGGEEDYITNESDIDCHRRLVRTKKVKLCFSRLKNDIYLSKEAREVYNNYLSGLNADSEYKDAWIYVKTKSINDFSVCNIFDQAGLFSDELIETMLLDIGEENVELKAFLIGKKGDANGSRDTFAMFDL